MNYLRRNPQASPPLEVLSQVVACLKDEDWNVRKAALKVLKAQASLPLAVLSQVVACLKDKEEDVRAAALKVLQAQASLPLKVLAQVVACLKDKKWNVRIAAKDVLKAQASLPLEVLSQVVACLKDKEEDVREAALKVLKGQAEVFDTWLSVQTVIPKVMKVYLPDILKEASMQHLLNLYLISLEESLVLLIVTKGIKEETALYYEERQGKKQLCLYTNKTFIHLEQLNEKQQQQLIKAIQRILKDKYAIKPFSETKLLTQGLGFFERLQNPFKQDIKESPTLNHRP